MSLHRPLAVAPNAKNPFGRSSDLNLRGSLLSDAHGPKYAYFGTAAHAGYVQGKPHQGTDYPAPIGTDVLSIGGGRILGHFGSQDFARGFYILERWRTKKGGWVVACYQHLRSFVAPVGADVSPGQHIAESGNSGSATVGSGHCHVEVRFTTVATADWHNWQSWRAVNLLRILPGGDLAASPYFLPA